MGFSSTLLLGAIAGFTIILGLPIARIPNPSPRWRAFLNALATGVLVFLLWDVITAATQPIDATLVTARDGHPAKFVTLLVLFTGGFVIGLMSLVYFEGRFLRRQTGRMAGQSGAPARLALMIAIGIGVHNFAEGLAIGQASRAGAIGLATVLIVGFGLHNATEGFGIAAPLAGGARPSWAFLGLAAVIGGGPTFLGTLVGYSVTSDPVFVLCLALAAGSIFYVIAELLHVGRRFEMRELAMWGVLFGFFAGYGTDLIVSWAGA